MTRKWKTLYNSSHSPFPTFFSLGQLWIYFFRLWTCLFWTFPVNETIEYVMFYFCLLSLLIMFSRSIHAVTCEDFISFYDWMMCHWMNLLRLVHVSADGQLDYRCFALLWIIKLWTFMCRFLCGHTFPVLLDIYLGVELQDHMVSLCLAFWETIKCFSKVAKPSSYTSTSNG